MPSSELGLLRVVFAVALLLAACTSGADGVDDAVTSTTSTTLVPEARSTLRVGASAWPSCFDPVRCADDRPLAQLVLAASQPRLFEIDVGGNHVASPVLASAPDLQIDPDTGRQRITYRIADAARWHDGRPITSSDLHATWMVRREMGFAPGDPHAAIVDVDDKDPRTAVVTLASRTADWRELFGGFTGWLAQADSIVDPERTGTGVPVGAGPFEVISADDALIVLAAVDEHWVPGRQASIDQVRIERLPPDPASWPRLDTFDVVISEAAGLVLPPGMGARHAPHDAVVGAWFDRRTVPLQQVEVRRAIASVLERGQLTQLAGPGANPVECLGWLPDDPACGRASVPSAPVDAEELLAEAGWVLDDSGLRQRAGALLSLPVTYDPAIRGVEPVASAVRIRLRQLGAVADHEPLDRAAWTDQDRSAGAGVSIQQVPLGTANRLRSVLACQDGTGPLAWCEPELEGLLDNLAVATSRSGRSRAGQLLADHIADAAAFMPLYQPSTPWYLAEGPIVTGAPIPGDGPLAQLWAWSLSAT